MSRRRATLGPGREFDLIRSALATAAPLPEHVTVGPGDDAAVFKTASQTVISSDLTIEGVHFLKEWLTPEEVGYRAAASALSDLAAMAAEPIGILLSIGVDAERAAEWIPAISSGAAALLGHTGGAVLGGDLSRVPDGGPIIVDVVAVGECAAPIERRGARVGDEVWITGELGLAALAVEEWYAGRVPEPTARRQFAHPTPRTREAWWLAERAVLTAMIDISDGLVADAGHIAAASGVHMNMNASMLPIPDALVRARGDAAPLIAVTGGEDYELCLTAPEGSITRLQPEFEDLFRIRLTRVGVVTSGAGVGIVGLDLTRQAAGHDHFQPDAPA